MHWPVRDNKQTLECRRLRQTFPPIEPTVSFSPFLRRWLPFGRQHGGCGNNGLGTSCELEPSLVDASYSHIGDNPPAPARCLRKRPIGRPRPSGPRQRPPRTCSSGGGVVVGSAAETQVPPLAAGGVCVEGPCPRAKAKRLARKRRTSDPGGARRIYLHHHIHTKCVKCA